MILVWLPAGDSDGGRRNRARLLGAQLANTKRRGQRSPVRQVTASRRSFGVTPRPPRRRPATWPQPSGRPARAPPPPAPYRPPGPATPRSRDRSRGRGNTGSAGAPDRGPRERADQGVGQQQSAYGVVGEHHVPAPRRAAAPPGPATGPDPAAGAALRPAEAAAVSVGSITSAKARSRSSKAPHAAYSESPPNRRTTPGSLRRDPLDQQSAVADAACTRRPGANAARDPAQGRPRSGPAAARPDRSTGTTKPRPRRTADRSPPRRRTGIRPPAP